MKYLILNLLMFLSLKTYSQNNLSSLFNIKDFPKDMPIIKSFIENSTNPYMIEQLITSGTRPSNNHFQFSIKSNKPLQFDLPNSNGISLSFFDYKSKLPIKSHKFYVDYQFLYLDYFNEFILDNEPFSVAKCYNLAYELNNDENPLSLVYFKLYKEYYNKTSFSLMFNEFYKNYKIKKPKKIEDLFDEENTSLNEKFDIVSEYITNEVDGELSDIIFKTFIQKKDKHKTWENIEKVFGKEIKSELDEIFTQKITINTNQQAKLIVPKFLTFTNENEFIVSIIECKLDFNNMKLSINFKSTQPIEMTIKNFSNLSNKKVVQSEKIKSNEVYLIISETAKELIVTNYNTKEKYKIEDYK